MSEQHYLMNLRFKNDIYSRFSDNENPDNGSWGSYGSVSFDQPGFDTKQPFNSVRFSAKDSYIRYYNTLTTQTNKLTIAIRYRIDTEHMHSAILNKKPIRLLTWDSGYVNLIDEREKTEGICLSVVIRDSRFEGVIDYPSLGYNVPAQLVLTIEGPHVVGILNGTRIIDSVVEGLELTTMTDITVGNTLEDSTIYDVDELCILDTIIHPTEFVLHPFHDLYPEVDTEKKFKRDRIHGSSYDRLISHLDIVRHADFSIPSDARVRKIRKYEFE